MHFHYGNGNPDVSFVGGLLLQKLCVASLWNTLYFQARQTVAVTCN